MGARAFTLAILLAACAGAPTSARKPTDLGRAVLAPNDGWASFGTGTTGGSLADETQVYTVTSRAGLIAALNNGVPSPTSPSNPSNAPKIIYVVGTIDGNVDENNQPLACENYFSRDPMTGTLLSYEAFLTEFNPDGPWGRVTPSGPLERARLASQGAQQARVRIRPGSNTTIVGLGEGATIRGVWLDIRGTAGVAGSRTNIIVRNITFEDTYDCFPQWSPTDGALGAWNALYDSISLRDADHVWIDHNTFRDRTTADTTLPTHFGVLFQVHDGLLDITNASDRVTVSWNRFENHDKLMLVGSSDSATADRGKLRVTLHHNLFANIGQRAPRVRFGQVHVYNNLYKIKNVNNYQYSWGAGIESQTYAENNFFKTHDAITPDEFIERLNGTALFETDTLVNGRSHRHLVDIVDAYNAVNDPDLIDAVSWRPTLFLDVDETKTVPNIVRKGAGPFRK